MKRNMSVIVAMVCLSVTAVFSSTLRGQIHILLAPSSYLFLGKEPLRLSCLESAIPLFMGKRFESRAWSGLTLKHPFDLSQSVVIIYMPGVSSFRVESLGSYPLIWDKSVDTIMYRMMFDDDAKVVYLDDKESVRKTYHVQIHSDNGLFPPEFGTTVNSYESFLEQLDILGKIGHKLSEDERRGQIHWIAFTGYQFIDRMHLSDHSPAVRHLKWMLRNMTKSLEANKNVRYLFALVNYPFDGAVRRKRQEESPAEVTSSEMPVTTANATASNTTGSGGAYGPPMFNLVFWSFFIWFLVLYGICIAFWFMNPGSQHAFYRMTEMKIKTE